jgi:hypothetical protein
MSQLQGRHFYAIADALVSKRRAFTETGYVVVANSFADVLSETNPAFDKRRFLERCECPFIAEPGWLRHPHLMKEDNLHAHR